MTSRRSRKSRRKKQGFVPDAKPRRQSHGCCWCADMGSLDGYGLPGAPPPEADPGESYAAVSPPSPEDGAVDFITYCVAVASGSPYSEADPHTHKAIELTAEALWPDVVGAQHLCFDAEAREVIVEAGDTAYRIRVREVPIATAHDPVDGGLGTRQQPPVRWQH